jgi:polysaccharide biosynthesis/export protein
MIRASTFLVQSRKGPRAEPPMTTKTPQSAFPRLWQSALLSVAFLLSFTPLTHAGEGESLMPGDVLGISVYNHPELQISVPVAPNRTIRMPLAGQVDTTGLSPQALAESLGKTLQEAGITDAFVTVLVTYTPRMAYVLSGGKGQAFDIPPVGSLSAMQAIIAAGGFSEQADLRKVAVLRTVDKATKRLPVDAVGFINAQAGVVAVPLQPGDMVVVPRAQPVTVLGMVAGPGTFPVDTAKPLLCSQMIGSAGGFQKGALREQVLVLRRTPEGKLARLVVNVDAALNGSAEDDIALFPGDTLIVKQVDRIYICGEVRSPGAFDPDPDMPLSMMRAIINSGGFTDTANQRKVALIRDGKSTDVDLRNVLLDSDKVAGDPLLKPGDMVFVRESLW